MTYFEALEPEALDGLVRLQLQSFDERWSDGQWQRHLESRRSRIWGIRDGDLKGYALFSTILDEAELLQVCIEPACRGSGLGWKLLEYSLTELKMQGIARVMLEVRASNEPARALYERLGFVVDGVRKDYYPTAAGREDAVLMSIDISP